MGFLLKERFLVIFITTLITVVCRYNISAVIVVEEGSKLVQCGGLKESNEGSLKYPEDNHTIVPGEVCVWTIHLDTTTDFRFNFSELELNSGSGNCTLGGVRIYSLTNLASSDQEEFYTFCSEAPSTGDFFLGKSVAVIVAYSSAENSNVGTGFTLNWKGLYFDQEQTKHLSSFTTINNNLIRFPAVGNYQSNLAATWLVKAETESSLVDLFLNYLTVESCAFVDNPCACDAAILYEVTPSGLVDERERFCGNVTTPSGFLSLSSKFIVAFFTDRITNPNIDGGFEVLYYPTLTGETVPTTVPPTPTTVMTSTTENPLIISTKCGEILESKIGKIIYKANETIQSNERCTWIIRTLSSDKIKFNLTKSDFVQYDNDAIFIDTFQHLGSRDGLHTTTLMNNTTTTAIVDGSITIVSFATENRGVRNRTGFILEFEANDINNVYNISSTSLTTVVDGPVFGQTGSLVYPLEGGLYSDSELSVMVIAPPNFSKDDAPQIFYNVTIIDLECCCYDRIKVFNFKFFEGFVQRDRYCSEDNPVLTLNTEAIAVVFWSDIGGDGLGFRVDWDWVPQFQ